MTVHGRPSAELLSPDDLDALETIAILSDIDTDTDTLRQLAAFDTELACGEGETEQLWLGRCAGVGLACER